VTLRLRHLVDDAPKRAKTDIALEVHRTLAESSVRKQNVVVTGLPESSDITDEQAFLALCEENFSVKPHISNLGCRRLGKVYEQYKSRKRLVHLRSEKVARDVLGEAKKLRNSDNEAVASSVYINPDWSPAESALAYENRQRKRMARQKRAEQERMKYQHETLSGPLTKSADIITSPDDATVLVSEENSDVLRVTRVREQTLTTVNSHVQL